MEIIDLEEKLNSHLLFLYTNENLNASIQPSMVKEIYNQIKIMNKYDKITLVINSNGGNLATGYRILSLIKEKYSSINTVCIEKASSTATFMLLSGENIYISPYALITPTEPQIEYNNNVISVNDITKYIKRYGPENIDPMLLAIYGAKIEYFKHLCNNTYDKDEAKKIIDFMLNKVSSHQYPMSISDLKIMKKNVNILKPEILEHFEKIHEDIKEEFNRNITYQKKYILIKNFAYTFSYEIVYNKSKEKVSEGYNRKGVKKMEKKNIRIERIENEMKREKDVANYNDAHWDSYNDSMYHDSYSDHYDDYGDGSYYHDSYKDAFDFGNDEIGVTENEAPKTLVKNKKNI